MCPLAALIAYSIAFHVALLRRECSHGIGGSLLYSRVYFPNLLRFVHGAIRFSVIRRIER